MDENFWINERQLLFRILFPLINDAALTGAGNAMTDLVNEIGVGLDWALINVAAREWAERYTFELVRGITDTSQRLLSEALPNFIESGEPLDALIDILEPSFGKTRAEMIAVTEVTRSFAQGNLTAWQASEVVDGKRWMTVEDERVCPICEPLDNQVVPLIELFDSQFDTPPAHVRCRCWIQPVVE